mgnify:CR=1 FL=1
MSDQPERFIDKLVGACFAILFGALALYGAVISLPAPGDPERVWVQLAIGAAALAAIGLLVLWWRGRWRRW